MTEARSGTRRIARTSRSLSSSTVLALSTLFLLTSAPLAAQETSSWRNTAELTYLVSGGNSQASTMGFRHALRWTSQEGELRVDLLALRTDATRVERRAVGTSPEAFELFEEEETVRTAERYAAQARYDHNLSERFFLSLGSGWERNTFAGFRHRTIALAGAGNRWHSEGSETRLGYNLTYTVQKDVNPDPAQDETFAGARVSLEHERSLRGGVNAELKWVIDGNAQDLSDYRGDLIHAISAALSDRLALKTSFQLLLDNDPPSQTIPLVLPDGSATGSQVRVPLGRVDHTLSVALVITL